MPPFFSSRPLQVLVDRTALAHNLAEARARAGARRVWAVVKANAYGHGIENAVQSFAAADGLALLETDEAQRVRAAGWRKPVLLLEGVFEPRDWALVAELDLTVVVHGFEQIAMLERLRPTRPVGVYCKFDTGMNRLGFAAADARAAFDRLAALGHVRIDALMTHLANADRVDAPESGDGRVPARSAVSTMSAASASMLPVPPTVASQRRALRALIPAWTGAWSVANSAALFLHAPDGVLPGIECVRPGIALYGASPVAGMTAADLGLRPAMRLSSRLLAVRHLTPGQTVGYGSRWTARRPSRIGVVACGYADGYPRSAPDGTPVWIDNAAGGGRVPLVGRVSMDMITVDLTDLPSASCGDAVELWGSRIGVDEVAACAGTIGYELLSALPARVREHPREHPRERLLEPSRELSLGRPLDRPQ